MSSTAPRPTLAAPGVELTLDPAVGGRIASLRVRGFELLVTEGEGPIAWGAYPMCPWAGRLRDGRLRFGAETYQLPLTMPPHAIHGTTWDRPWEVFDASANSATMAIALGPPWPFGGRATHHVSLDSQELRATLEVRADDRPMPVIVGWHPWFARRLVRGGPVELDLPAGGMLVRGPDGLPTGEVVSPPPGPWDDAFVELAGPPVVRWPGAVEVTIVSGAATCWVVYTERKEGICVEPQTGPPNGLVDGTYTLVEPGHPLEASMTLRWQLLED